MERKPIFQAVISLKPFFVKEFKDFKSANNIDSLFIVKKMYKQTHITRNGNEYDMYNYSLHGDNELITKSLFIRKWSIEDIYEGYWSYSELVEKGNIKVTTWGTWNDYLISDPNGELRKKSFKDLEEAIKSLILFSKYKNWENYESKKPK